jgi:hypothetical protein
MKSLILFTLLSFYVIAGTESCNPPVSVPPCDTNMWSYTYGPMERFGEPSPRGEKPPAPRSKLYHRCVTLRGKVNHIERDSDGDMKVKLSLFPTNFSPYTSERKGDFVDDSNLMVVEVVCAAPKVWRPDKQDWSPVTNVKNENAYKACKNYTNPHHLPELGPGNGKDMQTGDTRVEVGDNITVTGELVTDMGPCDADPGPAGHCHDWKEIHPVTELRKLRTAP